jgi:hypothetical protein
MSHVVVGYQFQLDGESSSPLQTVIFDDQHQHWPVPGTFLKRLVTAGQGKVHVVTK